MSETEASGRAKTKTFGDCRASRTLKGKARAATSYRYFGQVRPSARVMLPKVAPCFNRKE